MSTITVRLKNNPYPIVVRAGALKTLSGFLKRLSVGRDAVIITNPLISRLYGRALAVALKKGGFTAKVFEVEDSERAKAAPVAFKLIGNITRYAKDKKPVVIAFGGGVVGDLAGFVAAAYKRGVPLVQVPTTLLAQIDSSIGGKVAVDLPEGKNLLGAFYQPRLVVADVSLLKTLSDREVKNGLAEAIKYGAIADAELFAFIEKNYRALLSRQPRALTRLVRSCAAIKADVVAKDEKETKGLRTVLNFGHTAGHAIEAAASYDKYHHGEAIAVGMRVAAQISCRLGLLKPVEVARLNCLISAVGLPERIEKVALPKILKAMAFDKKFSGKTNRFVLLNKIGRAVVRANVPERMVRRVLADYVA
jgi:3-dehydroquinate synthase